ncbi:MAG: Ig-like domain-containing protein [archaeon]|nr:Ig-like domain-containing protein [archaeon]
MTTNYGQLTNKNMITVHKTKTILETQDSINLVYRNGYYSVTLKDQNNNPLPGEIVYIKVNGVTYPEITNKAGIATLPIELYARTYTITSTFLESYCKQASSISSIINIFPKEKCRIIADNYECEYKNGEYQIKILGENNLPIQYCEIKIKIKGVTYTISTTKTELQLSHRIISWKIPCFI